MEFKDYYAILGIASDADDKAIKTAYRKLARKYHPDMNPEAGAEEKFKEVAEAYHVLKDEKRRAEFDALRQYGNQSNQGFRPPPNWQETRNANTGDFNHFDNDFSEFFNSIFGGQGPGSRPGHASRHAETKGQDVEVEMPIFLEETVADNQKAIEFQIPVRQDGTLNYIKKRLNIKIPRGVSDGERIRLKGQGAPGKTASDAGDLYLHIRLVPHPLFDTHGNDLIIAVPISPWEAVLGAKISVPTLDGSINLTISPNSQAGKKLRIKGKGLRGKADVGDLYAVLKIVIPPTADEQTSQLWHKLSTTTNFDPRSEWRNKERGNQK
jgi:curved DNA-binding protein